MFSSTSRRRCDRMAHGAIAAMPTIVALLVVAAWCGGAENNPSERLAPLPAKVPAPADNPTTDAKVALGRLLFFDPRLSGENRLSCASCHMPQRSFADGLARSPGAGGKPLSRNSPSVLNVAYLTSYFWDGRAASLEEQALGPIQAADEMNQSLDELQRELGAVPEYRRRFREAFSADVSAAAIAQALAAFQRTLVSRDSPLDRYLAGDRKALSPAARRGMELFAGEAGCVRCHNGPLLTDGKFYRLGVDFRDKGRGAVTGEKYDLYKFRTPSLRDVAGTAPYMHDGSLKTLQDVVEFYYRTAPNGGPRGLPLDIAPMTDRSYSEVDDLLAFLKALSGKPPVVKRPDLP